jgi:hypothetical protein
LCRFCCRSRGSEGQGEREEGAKRLVAVRSGRSVGVDALH